MDQSKYDEINRLLKDISEDLDLPTDVVKRVYFAPSEERRLYIGSGEDFCHDQAISFLNRVDERSEA